MKHFDYIIAGAGCAGLSLAVHLADCARLRGKKILLVDKDRKQQNDRIWCFWETAPGLFESIVHRRWEQVYFHGADFSSLLNIRPYTYKMIRAADFYKFAFDKLQSHPDITFLHGHVEQLSTDQNRATIIVNGEQISAGYIFSSIPARPMEAQRGRHYLLQHFRGWVIEASEDVFNPKAATLMDFRVEQEHGASFVYILPFSKREALVEHTVFSPGTLPQKAYETALHEYLAKQFPGVQYQVREEEAGVIPMTNHRYTPHDRRIIFIGTAGGQTKPSTGYTFRFIQQHSRLLMDQLARTGHPYLTAPIGWKRFYFYDSVVLRILSEKNIAGSHLFSRMFAKNPTPRVFRFLDNVSKFPEELLLTMSLQKRVFIKAALKELFQ